MYCLTNRNYFLGLLELYLTNLWSFRTLDPRLDLVYWLNHWSRWKSNFVLPDARLLLDFGANLQILTLHLSCCFGNLIDLQLLPSFCRGLNLWAWRFLKFFPGEKCLGAGLGLVLGFLFVFRFPSLQSHSLWANW